MEPRENLVEILKTLFRWIKPIGWLCLIVGLGTAVISLLLPNYYESTTIFYAGSVDAVRPNQIFGTSTSQVDFYGTDRDNDRLMTIAESNDLADYIIEKFDLYEHYDIDREKDRAAYLVRQKFGKHYNVIKTKRDAIEISVEDVDKELAADMVNSVREKVNEMAVKVIKEQLEKLKTSLQKNIKEKEDQLVILNDSLQKNRSHYGVYNVDTQGEVFASQILSADAKLARESSKLTALQKNGTVPRDTLARLEANVAGYRSEVNNLNNKLQLFNQGLSKVAVLERQQRDLSNSLSVDLVQIKQLITALESDISAINLIEEGQIPVIKSRPKRSIIVLSAILVAFIFSVIGILLFESYKEVDWRAVFKGEKA